MRKKKFLIFLGLVLIHLQVLKSQAIKGVVRGDEEIIPQATILAKKDTLSSKVIAYTLTNNQGEFSLEINNVEEIFLEVNSFGYEKQTLVIEDVSLAENKLIEISLKSKLNQLDEIIIRSEKKSIKVKNDTTVYDPSSFKNGTEEVVEDLLKNLPGIKVLEDGSIKFKGKNVKRLLLEGDDLFNSNYTIGTRNIDVDLVEKLEAIENYVENPLLKGIESTDDVAINLKLKEGKTDISGNVNLGSGFKERYDFYGTGLAISKKIKSFGIIDFNNIGKNNSQYNFFSGNAVSLGEVDDSEFLAESIIQDNLFLSDLDDKRVRFNRNAYGNINSLFKINKDLSIKLNFDLYDDLLTQNQYFQTNYLTNGLDLSISQNEFISKTPQVYNSGLQSFYKISKNSLLEYNGLFKTQSLKSENDILNNNVDQFDTRNTRNKWLKQVINYTYRKSENSAFLSSFTFSKNDVNQDLNLTNGYDFLGLNNATNDNFQFVDSKKTTFLIDNTLLKVNKNLKYNFKLGYKYDKESLNSELFQINKDDNQKISVSTNNFNYTRQDLYLNSDFDYKLGNFQIDASFELKYLDLQRNALSRQDLLFTPKTSLKYSINRKSVLYSNYSLIINEPDLRYLFSDIILTGNRNVQNNEPVLEFNKNHNFRLGYRINDFFNLFSFNTELFYRNRKNNFFSKYELGNLFNVNTYFFLKESNEEAGASLNIENFWNAINSTLSFNGRYSLNNFNNFINGSDLRQNKYEDIFLNLGFKSGFLGKFNLENDLQVNTVTFSSDENSKFSNTNFRNNLNMFLKPTSKVTFKLGGDLFVPNTKDFSDNYLFFDTYLKFSSKNDKIHYKITSHNLINRDNMFESRNVTDFYESTRSYNVLEEYILFSVNFKF